MNKNKENEKNVNNDKYNDKAIRFFDKSDHYELIFTDNFNTPTSGGWDGKAETVITDVLLDLKEADKNKELHIFVGSFGGAVPALLMLIQQIQLFRHRIGINMGYAMSAGFTLLSFCHEIYADPYSMFMYHEMSSLCWGKVKENKNTVEFDEKLEKMLIENGRMKQLLTPEELKLGETTEVWLTGEDLIKRNQVMPYLFYNKRKVLTPNTSDFFIVNDDVYKKEGNVFQRYIKDTKSKKKQISYIDITLMNIAENITN